MKLRLPNLLKNALLSCFVALSMATTIATGAISAENLLGDMLFVGDSITQGAGTGIGPGYRYQFFKNVVDNGGSYTPVGDWESAGQGGTPNYGGTGAGNVFNKANSGHSGWWSGDLAETTSAGDGTSSNSGNSGSSGLPTWLKTYTPDTVYLMAGTNDFLHNSNAGNLSFTDKAPGDAISSPMAATAENIAAMTLVNLRKMILDLKADNADVKIYIGAIPLNADNGKKVGGTEAYNVAIERVNSVMKAGAAAGGYIFIDSMLGIRGKTAADSVFAFGDSIHPNAHGELIMAGNLARAMGTGQRSAQQTRKGVEDAAAFTRMTTPLPSAGSGWSQNGGTYELSTSKKSTWQQAWTGSGSTNFTCEVSLQMFSISESSGNCFSIQMGNGVHGNGTLDVYQDRITWGPSTLYINDNTQQVNDFRIAYIGNVGSAIGVATGYYIWMNGILIGEAKAASGSGTLYNGVILGSLTGGSAYAGVTNISLSGDQSLAPQYTGDITDAFGSEKLSGFAHLEVKADPPAEVAAPIDVSNGKLYEQGSSVNGVRVISQKLKMDGATYGSQAFQNMTNNTTGAVALTFDALSGLASEYSTESPFLVTQRLKTTLLGINAGNIAGSLTLNFDSENVKVGGGSLLRENGNTAAFGSVIGYWSAGTNQTYTGNIMMNFSAGEFGDVDHSQTETTNNRVLWGFVVAGGAGSATGNVSGNTSVSVTGGTFYNGIIGGGGKGNVSGNTSISILGGTIGAEAWNFASLFGGSGKSGNVGGHTRITIGGETQAAGIKVWNDIYGGSCIAGDVGGSSNIILDGVNGSQGLDIVGSIYGGSKGTGSVADSNITLQSFNETTIANIHSAVISGAGTGTGSISGTKTLTLTDVVGNLQSSVIHFNRVLLTGNTIVSLTGANTDLTLVEIGSTATLSLSDFAQLGGATLAGTGVLSLTGTSIILTSEMFGSFSGKISITGNNSVAMSSALYYGLGGVDRFEGILGTNIFLLRELTWINDQVTGTWKANDEALTGLWNDGLNTQVYSDGDTVNFNDSSTTLHTITLDGDLLPNSTSIVAGLWNFEGTGTLKGAGSLTISGGTLSLGGTTHYAHTGGTFLNGGTLLLSGGVFDAAPTITFGGGTLGFALTTDISTWTLAGTSSILLDVRSGVVVTAGAVVGDRDLTLSGEGVLVMNNQTRLATQTITVNSGTTLRIVAGSATENLAQANIFAGSGTIEFDLAASQVSAFNASNTFNGSWKLTQGVIRLNPNGMGTYTEKKADAIIMNGGILRIAGEFGANIGFTFTADSFIDANNISTATTIQGDIVGEYKLTKGSGGNLILNGNVSLASIDLVEGTLSSNKLGGWSYAGAFNVTASASLGVANGSVMTFSGASSFGNDRTLTAASEVRFTGAITATGTLTISGAGKFVFDQYDGDTTFNILSVLGQNVEIARDMTLTDLRINMNVPSNPSGEAASKLTIAQGATVSTGAFTLGYWAINRDSYLDVYGSLKVTGTTNVALGEWNGSQGAVKIYQGGVLEVLNASLLVGAWGNQGTRPTIYSVTVEGLANLKTIDLGQRQGHTVQLGTSTLTLGDGGEIRVGSGGIIKSNAANARVTVINLNGGTLGTMSLADGGTGYTGWSSALAMNLLSADTGTTFDTGAGMGITLSGALTGVGKLHKTGDGTLTLTGINTFSGGVVLSGGTLVAKTGTAADTSFGKSTSMIMRNGASADIKITNDLTIENAVAKHLTISSDGVHLLNLSGIFSGEAEGDGNVVLSQLNVAIGGKGKVGGITAKTMSITAGTTLFFDLADHIDPRMDSDFITVAGDLTFTGSGENTIMVNSLTGLGTGSYLLIQTGLATMDMSHWVLAGLSANGTRQTFNLGNEEIRGSGTFTGNVYLHVAGEAAILSWAGLGDDVWDRALSVAEDDADWTAPNGVSLSLGTKFHNLDQVQFLGDGAGNVNLQGELNPASILVNNAEGEDYVFQTTAVLGGSIAGDTTSLIKDGAGKLSLNLANTYGGGTTLKGGTLAIGNANALGAAGFFGTAGYIDIQGGTLDLQVANVVLSGKVSGDAVLTGSATGSFTGTLSLDTGVLSVGNLDLLGAGATLHFNGGALSLNASGDISGKTFTVGVGKELALVLDNSTTVMQAGASLLPYAVNLSGAGTLVYGTTDAKLAANSTVSLSGRDVSSILAVWASGGISGTDLGFKLSAAEYKGSVQVNSGYILANGSTLAAQGIVILNGGGITATASAPEIDWSINLASASGNFLRVDGATSLTINGAISTTLGAATLDLQGTGIVILGASATIGDTITVNFAAAAKLRLADHAGDRTFNNAFSFALDATLGGGTNVGDMIFAGAVNLGESRTLTVGSNVTFEGSLSGPTATTDFTKAGAGVLTLQTRNLVAANQLIARGGTLVIKSSFNMVRLRADAHVEIAEGAMVTISGATNGSTDGSNNTNSFYMGDTHNTFTMSGGTLDALGAELSKRDGNLTVNLTGGIANLKGIHLNRRGLNASHVVTFDGAIVHLGTSGFVTTADSKTYLVSGTLGSLGATWSSAANMFLGKEASGVQEVIFNTSQYDSVAKTYTTTASTITLSGILSDFDAENYSNIIKKGVGTLVLSGVNTFSGTVDIQEGILKINNIAALGSGTSAITMAAGTTLQVSYTSVLPMEFNRALTGAGTLSFIGTTGGAVKWTNTGESTLDKIIFSAPDDAGLSLFEMSAGTITLSNTGLGSGVMRPPGATNYAPFVEAALVIAGKNVAGELSELRMTGGTLNILQGTLRIQQNGQGAFTVNGASAVANVKGIDMTSVLKSNQWYEKASTVTLTAGTLHIGDRGIVRSESTRGTATINLSGGTLGALADWASAVGMTATADTTTTIKTQIWDTAAKDYTNNGATITLSQAVTGSGNIRKTGLGSLILSAANTATGKLTVEEGIVQLGAATASATGTWAGAIELYASAQLLANRSNAFTLAGIISGDGVLVKNATENLTLTGHNSYTGGTTINAGTVTAGHASALGTGAISLAGLVESSRATFDASTFAVANGITLETGKFGSVSGAGYIGTITTAGDLTLGSALGATATILLNGGRLDLATHALSNSISVGGASRLENATAYTGILSINSGTLTLSSLLGGAASIGLAGGTLDAGALALINAMTSAGTSTLLATGFVGTLSIDGGTLSLGSDLGGTAAMTINLAGGSLNMASHNSQRGILATGTGSLTGATNFTGALTVDTDGTFTLGSVLGAGSAIQFLKGSLDLNNMNVGRDLHITGAGNHTLTNNTAYTGNITLGGNLTVANLSLGGNQSLTLEGSHGLTGDLELKGGIINFDFVTTTGEMLTLTGDLTLTSASTLDIKLTGTPLAQNDVLELMTITGTFDSSNLNLLSVEINAGRLLGSLSMRDNVLIYTVNTVKNLYWKDGNGDWTQSTGTIGDPYNSTLPWLVNKEDVDDNRFFDKDAAVFDGTGGIVTITNTITAGSILVDSASNYSFVNGDQGKLSGAGSLTKSGVGTLTITGANDYSGNTILSGGIIHAMSQGALGSGTLDFAGGTLQVGTNYTLGTIGGTGNVNLIVDKDMILTAGEQLSNRTVSFSSTSFDNSGTLQLSAAVIGGTIELANVRLSLGDFASTSAITTTAGDSSLQGAAAYNGIITVGSGTNLLVIGNLKASEISLHARGALILNANETVTLTAALSGNGTINYTGEPTSNNTLTITTTVAGTFFGTLQATDGNIKFNQAGGGAGNQAAILNIGADRTITYTGNTLGAAGASATSMVAVMGAGTFQHSGAGLLLAQNAGFTGDVIVDKGRTLQLVSHWAFGNGQEVTVNGTVWMYGAEATSLEFNAGSTLNLTGKLSVGTNSNDYVNTVTFAAGSNLVSSATAMIDLTLQAGDVARAQTINFNFDSDQSYAGGIKAIGGIVNVNMAAGKTLTFTSYKMGQLKGNLNISSGTVKLAGAASLDSTNWAINLQGGGLDFSNAEAGIHANPNTITVTGSGSVLTGDNLATGYTGTVEIGGGLTLGAGMNATAKLNLNEGGSLDMAEKAVASTLTVAGAASLSNNTNFTGNVDFKADANLTVSNLQMNSGQSLTLAGAATITGNLSLNGGTLTFAANDVLTITGNLMGIGSSETSLIVKNLDGFDKGSYTLMNITGDILNIPTGKLVLDGQTGRSLANLSQTAHSIILNVQDKADSLDWLGSDGTWTQSTGKAHSGLGWNDAGSAWTVDGVGSDNKFYDQDMVEFKGTGATVTISGAVNSGSMLVSEGAFIFANAGAEGSGIAGNAALSITGGSLTMNGANTAWAGATSLTGGSLTLGNVGALGSGKLTYTAGSFGIAAGIEFTLTASNFALATDSTAVTLDVEGTLNADSSILGSAAAITTTGSGTLNLTLTENRTAAITNTGILNVINNGIGEISVGNMSGGTINIKGTGTIATTQSDLTATVDSSNLSLKMAGSAGNITLNNGAQLILAAVGSFSTNVALTGTTNTLSSTADVTLSGNITGAGDLNVDGGNNVALTGGFALNTLNILGSTNVTLGGANQSLTGIAVAGTLNINGALSLGAGGITGAGVVNMDTAALTATGDFSIANAVSLTNVSLLNTGAYNVSFDGALTGAGSLTKSGAGKLTLSNALTNASINLAEGSLDMAGSAATLRLTVDATKSGTLENAGSLNDASRVDIAGVLTTTGNVAGTLTLKEGGQLNLAGAMTNVMHVEGASTLNQQTGSWKSLKLASNANLAYQNNGVASALSLASGQKITADQGATINGALSFDGGTFSLNMAGFNQANSMVNINGALMINSLTTIDLKGLELKGGSKNILTLFTGTSDFVLDPNLLNLTGVDGLPIFSYDWSKSGNSLVLTLNLSNQLIWTGGKNNNWSYDSSDLNWDLGGAESQFYERDYVVFDESASDTARNITLVNDVKIGDLKPTSMTVSGAKDYNFGGTGSITVTGKMFKQGAGSLSFQNDGDNYFKGGMSLEAGTVNIAGNASVIAALDTEGQLNISSSKVSTFTEVQGAGNILIDSSTGGGAHLSSLNQGDYTGRVTIKQGTLTNDKALGAAKLSIEASGNVVLSGVTSTEVGSLSTTTGSARISGITGDVTLGSASFVLDSSSAVGSADFSGPIVTLGSGSNLTLDKLVLTITADFFSSMDLHEKYSFALTDGILGGKITEVDPYWNSLINVSFLGVNKDLYAMTLEGGTITVMWSDMKDHLYVNEDGSMMPNPSKPVSADELAKFKAVTVNGLLNIGSGNDTDLVLNNLNGNSELGNIVVKKGTSLTLHSDGSDRRDAYLGTITTNGVALVKTGTGTQILGSQLSTAGNVTVQEGSLEFLLGVTAKEILVAGSSNLNVAGDLIASKFTLESSATATISGSLASVAVLSLEGDAFLHFTGNAPSRVESLTMTGNSSLELAKDSLLEITKSASFGADTHVLGEGTLSICAGAALTLDASNIFAATVILDLAAAAGSSAGGSLDLGTKGAVVVGGLSGAGKITSSADSSSKGEIILNVTGDKTESFEGILTTTDTTAQAKDIVGTIIKEGTGTQELAAHGDSKQVVYNLEVREGTLELDGKVGYGKVSIKTATPKLKSRAAIDSVAAAPATLYVKANDKRQFYSLDMQRDTVLKFDRPTSGSTYLTLTGTSVGEGNAWGNFQAGSTIQADVTSGMTLIKARKTGAINGILMGVDQVKFDLNLGAASSWNAGLNLTLFDADIYRDSMGSEFNAWDTLVNNVTLSGSTWGKLETSLIDGKVKLTGSRMGANTPFEGTTNSANSQAGAEMIWDLNLNYFKATGKELNATGTELGNVLTSLAMMGVGTEATNTLLAAVAGSTVTALAGSQRADFRQQQDWIRNRTTGMGISPNVVHEDLPYVNGWIQANGGTNRVSSEGDEAGYDLNTFGGTFGFDVDMSAKLTWGFAFTANYNKLTATGAESAKGRNDAYYANLFVRTQNKRWANTFILTGGWNDAKLDRTVGHLLGSYTTRGTTQGSTIGAMYETTYDIPINENGTSIFQPLLNVSFSNASMDAYKEEGAGNAGLNVDSTDSTYGTVALGARLLGTVGTGLFGRASLGELRLQVAQDFGDDTNIARVGLGGIQRDVVGVKVGKTALQIGAGISVPVTEKGSLYFDVNTDFRSKATSVNGSIGYRINF